MAKSIADCTDGSGLFHLIGFMLVLWTQTSEALNHLQSNDEGTYTDDISLKYQDEPYFYKNCTQSRVIADEGSNVTIMCYAGGSPTPDIRIGRYDGSPLPNNQTSVQGNILEIINIAQNAEGKYLCVANNSAETITRDIQIEVRGRSGRPIIITPCPVNYSDTIIIVNCTIKSQDRPDVFLVVNGQKYQETKFYCNGEWCEVSLSLNLNHTLNIERPLYIRVEANNLFGNASEVVGLFSSGSGIPTVHNPNILKLLIPIIFLYRVIL